MGIFEICIVINRWIVMTMGTMGNMNGLFNHDYCSVINQGTIDVLFPLAGWLIERFERLPL
jgi:hypothetical protein